MRLHKIYTYYSLKYISVVFFVLLTFSACTNSKKESLPDILTEFSDANSKTVLVAAHRGAHNGNSENSISSIKHAIDIGVDIVELDVKVTKDGVTVLMHDGRIDRTTNGKGNVEDFTLEELKKFRLKTWYGSVSDEQIPTFEEALLVVKGNIMVDIDIKTSNVKAIVETVKKTQTEKEVFYFDNDYDGLDEIKQLDSSSKFMPRAYNLKMTDSALVRFKPHVIHIDPKFYTVEVVDLIKRNGARVWINSLGESDCRLRGGSREEIMKRLIDKGANIIQTDEPEIILEYLRSNNLHK